MTTNDKISRLPPKRTSQHFSALRDTTLELIGNLAAETWTDHNVHDPGITFAEAYIYALTDVAFRTQLPMRDLLVAVDLSGSMETRDFTDSSGAVTDRLSAARQVLDDFLSRRDGDRVGLVFFGSAAYVQAPFTQDLDVVRALMDEAQVRMLGPKTMLGDAIGVAINLFERSEVDDRVLIVLTDGNDTGSQVPPERAAEIARDKGVTIYTIAMGDPQAAGEQALDEKTLQAIAATTGGQYFHAQDRAELDGIYATLDQLNPRQVETLSYRPEYELYFWPGGFSLLLSLLFFSVVELRSYRNRQKPAQQNIPEAMP